MIEYTVLATAFISGASFTAVLFVLVGIVMVKKGVAKDLVDGIGK